MIVDTEQSQARWRGENLASDLYSHKDKGESKRLWRGWVSLMPHHSPLHPG